MTSPLVLAVNGFRCEIVPDMGACIAGLWLDGVPVLRSPGAAALASVRQSGSYPLVPFSNRIGQATLQWNGTSHPLVRNFGDEPHAIHGVGWQRPWAVLDSEDHFALLSYEHKPDASWPFAFDTSQAFRLTGNELEVTLSITNQSTSPTPVGLGWHPYFPKRARSRLHIELTDRWDNDPSGLPVNRHTQPGIDSDVAHLAFDNCFEGWRGAARLRDEKLSMRITSSLPYLVVFTPDTKPYYCVEPVSHVSNAIHMSDPAAHGLRDLAPGATFDAWMKLEVAPA